MAPRLPRLRLPAGLCALVLCLAPVSLPLPPEARAPLAALRSDCPECLESGVLPCGSAEIGEGPRFAKKLHQGAPPRGYLFASDYVDHFDTWYRDVTLPDRELHQRVRSLLDASRLIAVEEGFGALRSLGAPASIEVEISTRHRLCLASPEDHECPGAECCNKRYGSTAVRASFRDPEDSHPLVWVHHPAAAQTILRRGPLAYFCLAWESGVLLAPEPEAR